MDQKTLAAIIVSLTVLVNVFLAMTGISASVSCQVTQLVGQAYAAMIPPDK